MTLYHYTCSHAYPLIQKDGLLRPGPDGLVWLTDIAPPAPRLALGLTSYMLKCDRLAHVFVVEEVDSVVWWMEFRKQCPAWLLEKETCPGVMPMHWFVSTEPVPVISELLEAS
jgi:hypothetical protein